MIHLIFETSSEKGCIVLAKDGHPIAFQPLPAGPALSKTLALEVKDLVDKQRIDLIAVGTGPGSYTGVRVGAALAKALSYGWKVPLIGFCSLEAFGPAPVLVDARSGGFYTLLEEKPSLLSPTDPKLQEFSLFRSPHPELIKKRFNSPAEVIEVNPDPARLAKLVYEEFLRGNPNEFELNYLAFP